MAVPTALVSALSCVYYTSAIANGLWKEPAVNTTPPQASGFRLKWHHSLKALRLVARVGTPWASRLRWMHSIPQPGPGPQQVHRVDPCRVPMAPCAGEGGAGALC